jgi:hypothetical protein
VTPADGLFQRGAGLAVEKRQAPAESPSSAGRASPSRSLGGTHPGRVSLVWNVETPLGSGAERRRSADREEGPTPQREQDGPRSERRWPKGNGNPRQMISTSAGRPGQPAGYGHCPDRKGADVGQVGL